MRVTSSPRQPVFEHLKDSEHPADVFTSSFSPPINIPSTIPVRASITGEPEFPPKESVLVLKIFHLQVDLTFAPAAILSGSPKG